MKGESTSVQRGDQATLNLLRGIREGASGCRGGFAISGGMKGGQREGHQKKNASKRGEEAELN